MMSRLLEYLKVALANLKTNKKRTFLTMLGIIIGISSVIMILAAGGGAKNMINEELNSVFSGMIYFYIEDTGKANMKYFTEDDIRYICDNAGDHLYGATQNSSTLPAKANTIRGNYDIYVDSGTPAKEHQSTDKIVKGRYFNFSEYNSAASVCIITEALAKKLFGTTDVLGKNFEINVNDTSNEVTIIGIRETKQSNGLGAALTGKQTDLIEIPYSVMERKFGFGEYESEVILILADNEYSLECSERVQKLFEAKHNVRETGAFGIESWTDAAKQYDVAAYLYPAYAYNDPRRTALYLLNNILGGPGMNARLSLSLRERHGLVYTVESTMATYGDTGIWSIYFGCDHHDVNRCRRLVRHELDRLMQKPLSQRQLMMAKRQLKGQLAIACDNREQFALDFGRCYLHHGYERDIETLYRRIDALTAEELQTVACELFAPDHMTTLIIK